MSEWLPALPPLVICAAILLLPGAAVAYAAGLRGIAAWGVAPGLGTTVVAGAAVVAPVMHLSWQPWLLLAATAIGAVLAYLVGFAVRPGGRAPRGYASRDPERTLWFAVAGVALGVLLALVAVLPGVGRPEEMVQSTDAVAHLNRIRRFLETGVFSSLGSADQAAYPSAFHDVAASLAQVLPGLAEGRGIVVAANLTAVAAAAVIWPLGVVALVRVTLGRSAVLLVAGGLLSAAFTAFPYVLMGWGVLWPNLLGTALLPGLLGPALVAVGCVAPLPGLPRRLAVVATVAALPGLALAHPNALVSLVLFVVLAVATRFALQWRRLRGAEGRRAGVRLLVLGLVVVLGLLVLPQVSRQVADTASYDWGASDQLGPTLRDSALLGLQVGPLPWGLLALMAIGLVGCVRRIRLRWVVVTWAACVVLFAVAATGTPGWGSLLTGYWYNDKVRIAALGTVPAVLLAVVGTHTVTRWLTTLLSTFSPPLTDRTRRPWALPLTAGAGALFLVATVTGGVGHEQTGGLVNRYYHPDEPYQVLLTDSDNTALRQLARLIPPAAVTANVPANGSAFLYAFHERPVVFESLLLDPDPDHALIGEHLRDAAARPDVCDALRRENVRYAITGPERYWLNLYERTPGIAKLEDAPGFQQVGASGRYKLFRIQACGFDPGWLPTSSL
ncbi:MAG TPA: DUF6541 family protein [Lapillicoccus sp.]|nr:DUF6541 family protein [Lapillicoccus sp.]